MAEDTLNATAMAAHDTAADPGPVASVLGAAAYHLAKAQPFLPMYAHLVISALFPIYAGAHASLSRPSSAAKPSKKKDSSSQEVDDDDDEEEEEEMKMEGLSPSDALIFPIMAAVVLTGLYLIIKWLEDPALLNKILGWYFAGFGVFGTAKLLSDAFAFVSSLLLPRQYTDDGILWTLDFQKKRAVAVNPPVEINDALPARRTKALTEKDHCLKELGEARSLDSSSTVLSVLEKRLASLDQQLKEIEKQESDQRPFMPRVSPLPGSFSRYYFRSPGHRVLPVQLHNALWFLAEIPRKKLILKISLRQKTVLSTPITAYNVISLVIAFASTLYFNIVDKPWYLTNLHGFSFSYSALQLMSPTTFGTGALLLSALFFYDVYMVFYT